jgi:Ca2+-binding RTX toxin-like protein
MATYIGTNHADTIMGEAGSDFIWGKAGNDLIYGDGLNGPLPPDPGHPYVNIAGNTILAGAGNDTVYAGYGPDTVLGGCGNDLIIGWGHNGGTSIYYRDGDASDVLLGGNGNDTLLGGGGADTIDGGNGNDVLQGHAGPDVLTGGQGNDIFKFGGLNGQAKLPVFDTVGDVVTDFGHGHDKLDLTDFQKTYVALYSTDPKPDFQFIGTKAPADPTKIEVGYHFNGANTVVDVNMNHFVQAEITLLGHHVLTAHDFIFS